MNRPVFLCGPWLDHELLTVVTGAVEEELSPANLLGYEAQTQKRNVNLVPTEGHRVDGLLWMKPTDFAMEKLALFEAAYGKSEIQVCVETSERALDANAFATEPDGNSQEWDVRFAELMHFAAEEIFDGSTLPTKGRIAEIWPMVEKRAWARVLAKEFAGPADVRHTPIGDEIHFASKSPRHGKFYRTQDTQLIHRRFDGEMQGPLQREVFYGVDAALVLPYDPKTDRILLIEQLRMGPLMRSDPNPWALEPIAGMVDAGEEPEATARRETLEEAGLEQINLQLVSASYPSPGSSTDFFYSYLGICDLPEVGSYLGGLASEHEDLKAHVMPFERGMELVRSHEIQTGPLIALMLWLAMERPKLR